jgi:hypothetical protein
VAAEDADWDRAGFGAAAKSNATDKMAKNRIKVFAHPQFGLVVIAWISAM